MIDPDDSTTRGRLVGAVLAAQSTGRGRLRSWSEQMVADADDGTHRGTRWGRGTAALVPSVAAVVIIGFAIAEGVLAASFNVANQPFSLHVASLTGNGLGGVLASENIKGSNSTDSHSGVLHAGLRTADLQGLCIVVHQSLLGVKYSITVGAGGSAHSNGSNLYFDITDLNSTPATLRNAILGESADEVQINGNSLGGAPGGFGLDVTKGTVQLQNVVGSAYQAQVAGALTLPNLAINVKPGYVESC